MRLGGGISYDGDPLTMSASGNDYAELCDLGPTRWNVRSSYHTPPATQKANLNSNSGSNLNTSSAYYIDSSHCYESDIYNGSIGILKQATNGLLSAENIRTDKKSNSFIPSSRVPINNSSNSFREARSNLYFSPSGTSYSTLEHRPNSPHFYSNTLRTAAKSGSLPERGSVYLSASTSTHMATSAGGTLQNTSEMAGHSRHAANGRNNNTKKLPISPEQVLRMFGATSSIPSSSYHISNDTLDLPGRRSPAGSPPSTKHQIYRESDRDRSIPNIQELSTRTVTMSRDQQVDHGFGICVKGGKDSGRGVYISRIEENSVAERSGLRPGHTILEVNGTPFTSINPEEAVKRCVQILKSSRQISMTVQAAPVINSEAPLHGFGPPQGDTMYTSSTPLLPKSQSPLMSYMGVQENPASTFGNTLAFRQTCSWMDRQGRPSSPPVEYNSNNDRCDRIRRVDLLIEPGQSLGLMIRGGVEYGLGIFITGVDKESVADRAGLLVGDEILEVNGNSFHDVTHDEAVSKLKYHKSMSLVIRDVGKVPHSCTSVELEPWDAYAGTRVRRKSQITTMVEEKARSLLQRHQFVSLSYYIAEYGAKGMTIDAFVAVLLEMLNTNEKHTLVTEIRELIFPEDRMRYDELVYRLKDPHSLERHRGGYLDGLRTQLGGLTQRVKSWYWGRPLSLQRLPTEPNGFLNEQTHENNPNVVPDHRGNLHITVKKSKPILGIAIEGGANTKHPLPRIINIHENGAAHDCGGLEVGQLILEVDGTKVEGLHHQEVARQIAESFGNREKPDITFLVVEAKKSNLEPKPTALIFLEA